MAYKKVSRMKRNSEMFVTYTKPCYLIINVALKTVINDKFDFPETVNLYVDEENRKIKIKFLHEEGDYSLSFNGTGLGYKVSFSKGKEIGLEYKRYYDFEFEDGSLVVRY